MEKTVTIKIGGTVFHIEDEAFELLKAYLSRVENFYSTESVEIISDIEDRIAELLNDQITEGQIANTRNIQSIIDTIGEPEEFEAEDNTKDSDDSTRHKRNTNTSYNQNRRFFRDPYNKRIGGVCSGVATYTNSDISTVRLVTALMILLGGVSIWMYIIIWFVAPKAINKEQIKQMKGDHTAEKFIHRVRDQFNALRVRIVKMQEAPLEDRGKYRDDIVKLGARFTLTVSTVLLFLTIIIQSISIPFSHNNFHYELYRWNSFINFSHPVPIMLQGLIWFFTLVTIASLIVNFIYSEHKQKLSRDPENAIVGGVCGGIGRTLHIDPVIVRLLGITFIIQSPIFLVAYVVLWVIFPATKYIIKDKANFTMDQENKIDDLDDEFKKQDNTSWSDPRQTSYQPSKSSTKVSRIMKALIIAFIAIVALSFIIPLIVILFGAIGVASFLPSFLEFGEIASFLPRNIEITQLISASNLLWGQIGVILIVLLPILFIAILLFSLFRKIKFVGITLLILFIGWMVSIGLVFKTATDEIKNYKEVANTNFEEELSFDSDTITIVMSEANMPMVKSKKNNWIQWASGTTININDEETVPSIALTIEKSFTEEFSLIQTKTGRGKTINAAQESANHILWNYNKRNNVLEFPKRYELIPEAPFRAQTLILSLRIPVGKTVYIDKTMKNYLDNVQNRQDMWDEEMIEHYWTMTEEGLSVSNQNKKEL